VIVHGAGAALALLRTGQLDELELHVVPVLLGQRRRLVDNLPAEHIDLDLVRRLTTPEVEELALQHVAHLRYRVRRGDDVGDLGALGGEQGRAQVTTGSEGVDREHGQQRPGCEVQAELSRCPTRVVWRAAPRARRC